MRVVKFEISIIPLIIWITTNKTYLGNKENNKIILRVQTNKKSRITFFGMKFIKKIIKLGNSLDGGD